MENIAEELPQSSEATEESAQNESRKRSPLPNLNSAAKLGLPPIPSPKLGFDRFVSYWRGLNPAQRERTQIYVYRLFPVIRQQEEHNIDKLRGEFPLGGETGDAPEDVLERWGLGDYMFEMVYACEVGSKKLIRSWLAGYKDGLPGFTSFSARPPIIADLKDVLVDHERNIKSGYITYLKSIGQLPGDATLREESNMAETTAVTSAMGRVMEKVVDKAFEEPKQAAVLPPVSMPEWKSIDRILESSNAMHEKAMETITSIQEKNAIDPVQMVTAGSALVETFAKILRPAPVPPVDFSPFMQQISDLNSTVIGMTNKRADDLAGELSETRGLLREALTQLRNPSNGTAVATTIAPVDPLDALANSVERINRLKESLGVTNDDDRPRRRRRYDDEDEDQQPKREPFWVGLLQNAPMIISGLASLVGGATVLIHNARVAQTGEGEMMNVPTPPPAPPAPASPPVGMLPNPAAGEDPMLAALNFLRSIEHGLIGALERGDTGYEYAELFIKTRGRTGDFGYQALKTMGDRPPLGDPSMAFPARAVRAICSALSQYAPLWSKIGNDPRVGEFFSQFVTLDEFLVHENATSLDQLKAESGFATITEYLNAPPEEEDGGARQKKAPVQPPN